MSDLTPRELQSLMEGAPFTSLAVDATGDLTAVFGTWTMTTQGTGWRILDEAKLVVGCLDKHAASAVAGLTLGAFQGFYPSSKFDLHWRAEPRWMIEVWALSATTSRICTFTGPGGLRAAYRVGGDFEIERSN